MQDQNNTTFTPAALRKMRSDRGMTLKDFWGAIGYTTSRGCAYETDRTELPEHARRLVYLEYIVGIPTDIDSERFKQLEAVMKAINPDNLVQVRQVLESGIDAMKSTLTRLTP